MLCKLENHILDSFCDSQCAGLFNNGPGTFYHHNWSLILQGMSLESN
jgi:hypothetical protein